MTWFYFYDVSYLNSPPEETSDEFDLCQWWATIGSSYPILQRLARDILPVQASRVSSERIFSSAGSLISLKRNRLNQESIRASMCIKHWSRYKGE